MLGRLLVPGEMACYIETLAAIALCLTTFCAGVGIGAKKGILKKMRRFGLRILLIPLSVIIGTLTGGFLAGFWLGISPGESGAVAAGFAYYSVSVGILTELGGSQLGALAFLANALREMLALAFTPLVAKHLPPQCAVALGGATTMDTTLPVISKAGSDDIAAIAVVNGVILTMLVPVLTPLLYQLP